MKSALCLSLLLAALPAAAHVPPAKVSPLAEKARPAVLHVRADGSILLGGRETSLSKLPAALRRLSALGHAPPVRIRSDDGVSYRRLVAVIHVASRAARPAR